MGSMHVCPLTTGTVPHVGGPISGPGIATALLDGQPVAVVGDMCTCCGPPDVILQGAATALIDGKPIALMGSMTAHGGQIVQGIPTATIGPADPPSPRKAIADIQENELLETEESTYEEAELEPEVGAVTGLAWTSTGGDLLVIEALRMTGTGRLTVTGQLGDVMRESVDAAYSYVRSRASTLEIPEPEFKETDIHVHFPAGAIPKDGPSAGIAVTLAIASVLSRRPVRRDLAMTGEVTLRGRVLEIGGVKEKVLAAYRAGLREVILPKSNEKDLRDVPDEVKSHMAFTFVRVASARDWSTTTSMQSCPSSPPRTQAGRSFTRMVAMSPQGS